MSNIQKPASATAKEKKLMLFPGDPLIKTLKPDYYVIVDPGSLEVIFDSSADASEGDPDDPEDDPEDPYVNNLKSPSLSDITLVSKTKLVKQWLLIKIKISLLNLYLMLKIVVETQ